MNTEKNRTPIQKIEDCIYIKRDDLIPFSFGGNKARKAELYFEDFDKGDYDSIVTYGSSSSNHCRIIANHCISRGIECHIVSPLESSYSTFNSELMKMFQANIITVPVDLVHDTIENEIDRMKNNNMKPYFIPGGGHGNIGTQAYVNCYDEIKEYEKENNIFFDYIFHASGTGTTQAGLVSGQLINKDKRKIVGISIARKNPRGRDIVVSSISEYMGPAYPIKLIDENTIFEDNYASGYGKSSEEIRNAIDSIMKKYAIPMDETYTGKAFYGMQEYIKENNIRGKNILFIHTGGLPLYFDYLAKRGKE